MNLLKDCDVKVVANELVKYMCENPITYTALCKELGISFNSLKKFLGIKGEQQSSNIKVILTVKKFLEDKKHEKQSQ